MLRYLLLLLLTPALVAAQDTYYQRLETAARKQTEEVVRYDPAYVSIKYPGGDVPAGTGVCTDVVIRAYRPSAWISRCWCTRT